MYVLMYVCMFFLFFDPGGVGARRRFIRRLRSAVALRGTSTDSAGSTLVYLTMFWSAIDALYNAASNEPVSMPTPLCPAPRVRKKVRGMRWPVTTTAGSGAGGGGGGGARESQYARCAFVARKSAAIQNAAEDGARASAEAEARSTDGRSAAGCNGGCGGVLRGR